MIRHLWERSHNFKGEVPRGELSGPERADLGLHVGLAGAGRIGAFHARTLAGHPLVERLTVNDVEEERARRVAADLGAACVPTPENLLASDLDALVIAAATPAHAGLIHQCADARLPCFCEKPIALDLESTDAVLSHVAEAGILLQIGFQRRFDAGYQAARAAVASGALGELRLVRAAGHDPAPPPEEYIARSGGLWRDMLVHDFDVMPWVLGREVVEVYADGTAHDEVFARYADVDAGAAVLRFTEGLIGVLTSSRVDPLGYDIRLELFGTRDSVAVGWDSRTPLRSLEPGTEPPTTPAYRDFMDRFQPAFMAELDAFLRAAARGEPSPVPGEEARRSLVVALACERSRREHRPVDVSEVA